MNVRFLSILTGALSLIFVHGTAQADRISEKNGYDPAQTVEVRTSLAAPLLNINGLYFRATLEMKGRPKPIVSGRNLRLTCTGSTLRGISGVVSQNGRSITMSDGTTPLYRGRVTANGFTASRKKGKLAETLTAKFKASPLGTLLSLKLVIKQTVAPGAVCQYTYQGDLPPV